MLAITFPTIRNKDIMKTFVFCLYNHASWRRKRLHDRDNATISLHTAGLSVSAALCSTLLWRRRPYRLTVWVQCVACVV